MAGTPGRRVRKRNIPSVTEHRVAILRADTAEKLAATLTEMLNDDGPDSFYWEFGPAIYERVSAPGMIAEDLWYCMATGWREVEVE